MSRRSTPPKYARHSSGQARVRIDGRVVYLGEYGSRESREKYALIIADWLDDREDDGSLPDLTVEQLSLAYLAFAKDYYVKNGETTDHVYTIRAALKILVQYHRGEPARGFSPKRLKRLQAVLTSRGLSRRYLNDLTGVIKRCFKWAASEELIPVTVYDGLRTVDGVRKGRSEARETDRVKPVNDDNVRAVLPFVSMQIKAMIQLQRLTGMRPGEVLIMRPCDVSLVADGVGTYRPRSHKTQHHGHDRVICLGQQAQQILRPWLDRVGDAYCFQPAESDRRKNRCTATCKPYRRDSYTLAIRRACERAGIDVWSPNQLRHAHATLVREQFGLEAAQVVLGHARADVTQIYAERDLSKAREVAALIG